MPEGDTVWNTARVLERALVRQTLSASDFRVPALATVDLAGLTVIESATRGKHLLLRLSGSLTLHSHLRMDGSWRVFGAAERWRGGPAHLIRVILRTPAVVAVGSHVHDLAILPTADEASLVGHLGPDLLGAPDQPGGWDPGEAVRRLRAAPARPIGEALLDQRNLAGMEIIERSGGPCGRRGCAAHDEDALDQRDVIRSWLDVSRCLPFVSTCRGRPQNGEADAQAERTSPCCAAGAWHDACSTRRGDRRRREER